jgi:hypothetical protein
MPKAMTNTIAFSNDGGDERWREFQQRFADYVAAAALAIITAQQALRKADPDFSEYTDPAFAGLVEGDDPVAPPPPSS